MSRYAAVRLIESFFRRWWLYLLPVLLLGAVGAKTAAATKDTYRSVGTLTVASSTLVEKLSSVSNAPNFGYDTPAGATTKSLIQQQQTDAFIKDVANRAGLTDALASGPLTVPLLRASILTWADGTNLFHVVVTMDNPVTAQKVAAATIAAFTQNVLDANLADSDAAVTFYNDQAATYQTAVNTARAAYNKYLTDHPEPQNKNLNRPADELAAITQLQSDVTQAQNRYDSAFSKSLDAQAVSEQTKSDVGHRLRVVDEPTVPLFRQPKLRGMALTLAMFVVIGFILAAAAVVIATAFDHGMRTPLDVRERLGIRPLAAIPDVGAIPTVNGAVAVQARRVSEAPQPRRAREAPAAWEVPSAARPQSAPLPAPVAIRPGGPRSPRTPGAAGVGNSRRGGAFVAGRRGQSE